MGRYILLHPFGKILTDSVNSSFDDSMILFSSFLRTCHVLCFNRCLRRLNVSAADSRDSMGRGRFFPFPPERHLPPGGEDDAWFREAVWGNYTQVCSEFERLNRQYYQSDTLNEILRP